MKLPFGYQADIKRIKEAGFTHFKVELEANLDREEYDAWNDGNCERYVMDCLSAETAAALTYKQFYNDGSVDSELTFTLPIEEAYRSVEVLKAFSALAEEVGHGMETGRAGMHLTLLTSGTYPTAIPLNATKLRNFAAQVTKLLPALYAVSSHDGQTRALEYRTPQISPEKDGVYPAICTHDGTALEYRLFDTCYDKPEALLEKIQIIAATTRYFHPTRKVKLQSAQFRLEQVAERYSKKPFAGTIKDLGNLQALEETLKLVKPASVSMNSFKKSRGLNLSARAVSKWSNASAMRNAISYQAYTMNWRRQYHERLVAWLGDVHPDAATKAGIAQLMPEYNRWYNANYGKPTGYAEYLKTRPVADPYRNATTINLTEPPRAPRMTFNEFIYTEGGTWQ